VYIALRNLPSGNLAGGPLAAAKLLVEACQEIVPDMPLNLLVNQEIKPVSAIYRDTKRNSKKHWFNWWNVLQRYPNSMLLNALHGASLKLRKIRLKGNIDLNQHINREEVVVHSFISNYSLVLGEHKRLYKLVHSEHSKGGWSREFMQMYPEYASSRLVRRMRDIEAKVCELVDTVVFPSKGAYYLFRDHHTNIDDILQDKVRIIYTGVPDWLEVLKHSTNKEGRKRSKVLLNVAHHVPEKRVDRFSEAVNLFLTKRGINATDFVAFNIGQSTRYSEKLIGKHVKAVGMLPHNEVIKHIADSWVLIHLPEVAVFDLVILEAMSLGKPIIASKVGGNVEALGEDYPLYASNPEEVAHLLYVLKESPDFYHNISQRNRTRYLNLFTYEVFVKAHLDLWFDLVRR